MIHAYQGVLPKIHPTAFVETSAHVIGEVKFGFIRRSAQNHIRLRAEYLAAEGR